MTRQALAVAVVMCLLFLLAPLGHGDRCILPITDVDVYGPGQKAIIAWNGQVERLILSTDLYATMDTRALEILPLPSEPSVDEAAFESFQAVQQLMMNNLPRVSVPGKEPQGLEIVFHERIGAHDITVVEATSVDELINFVLKYAREMGVSSALSVDQKTRNILEDYVTRAFNYWVFDLVDVYSATKTVEPVVYEFRSVKLYYPLKVSATAKGRTNIILYLITPEPISEQIIPAKMRVARYQPIDQRIQFQLSSQDLATIDPNVAELFPAVDGAEAWFTAVKYEGELQDLDFDFEVSLHPTPCRSIEVDTDKAEYWLGESVRTTVQFTHLLPECVEIQVVHLHQVRLEVRDSTGARVGSWQWQTNSDLTETVTWKPEAAGIYSISASSWWNGEKWEVEDHTEITVSEEAPSAETISPSALIQWFMYGVIIATMCILAGVAIAYLLLRSRAAK